jgi:hypothetical protein
MSTIVLSDGTRLVQERTARTTGTVVQLIDNRDGSFDPNAEENPWYLVCRGTDEVSHGGLSSHLTRKLAGLFAPAPEEWCPVCQGTDDGT